MAWKLLQTEFIDLNYLREQFQLFKVNMKVTLERLNQIKQLHKNAEIEQLIFEICYSSLEQVLKIEQALSYCEHNQISEGLYRVIEHRKSRSLGKDFKTEKELSEIILNKKLKVKKLQQETSKNRFFSFFNVFKFWGFSINNQKKYRLNKNEEKQPIKQYNYLPQQEQTSLTNQITPFFVNRLVRKGKNKLFKIRNFLRIAKEEKVIDYITKKLSQMRNIYKQQLENGASFIQVFFISKLPIRSKSLLDLILFLLELTVFFTWPTASLYYYLTSKSAFSFKNIDTTGQKKFFFEANIFQNNNSNALMNFFEDQY